MSFKKRVLLGIALASLMAMFSILLSHFNNNEIEESHLIGVVIAGIIIGYWFIPITLKKNTRKNSD
ncbi:hypothetical protein ABFG93_21185 (plasmid) [Pseudalkalibacillus hwajinpoensis]|uniref:hypothetical protein n=1 Tax=Guptibacillus hwajinpoensis TaxID=208199 RepID=UPI00325ABC46